MPEAIRAEAAVWLARLHSDARSEETEQSFRAWLAQDAAHAAAFERLTNTWEATEGLRRVGRVPGSDEPRGERSTPRRGWLVGAAALAASVVVAVAVLMLSPMRADERETFETAFGERRSLTLADGSRLVLNTDTRAVVAYSEERRLVTLERGQARFEVAKNADRPFVVRAGGKQIVALGTSFDVRWTDAQLSIVLFEGRVKVLPANERASLAGVTLEPGERVQFERPLVAVKSQPKLEREEAWVTGRVIFEATPLESAIAEMNRYARTPLQIADPALARMPISGTFSVDDTEAFARALADVLSLHVETSDQAIVLKPQRG